MKIPSELELLKEVNAYLRNARTRYQTLYDEVGVCEKAMGDINHAMEYMEYNRTGNCRLVRLGREWRRKRRAAKEEKELLEPIIELLNRYPRLVDDVSTALGKVKRISGEQETRVYTPRVLDLEGLSNQHFDTAIKETAKEKAAPTKGKLYKLKKKKSA